MDEFLRQLASNDQQEATERHYCRNLKTSYDQLREAGFDRSQALQLVIAHHTTLLQIAHGAPRKPNP